MDTGDDMEVPTVPAIVHAVPHIRSETIREDADPEGSAFHDRFRMNPAMSSTTPLSTEPCPLYSEVVPA